MEPPSPAELEQWLTETEKRLALIAANLPEKIRVVDLGVREKEPYLALTLREALIWRVEELGATACATIRAEKYGSATLVVRALIETCAILSQLRELLDGRTGVNDDVRAKLYRMLFGARNNAALPDAINVLTFIDHLQKRFPGTRVARAYDLFSEYAHPNWAGVAGLYATMDHKLYETRFGTKDQPHFRASLTDAVGVCVKMAETDYNALAQSIAGWIKTLTSMD